jgi:translation initiation factor 2 subunit 3
MVKAEIKSKEELPVVNVGIVGHIDHGKTTLLSKLSGKWTDTHSEEMKRGITIKLGYADIILYNSNGVYGMEKKGDAIRHVSFVDAPGHEMLMATMLSGAALIDVAILVVAANEGIKPQTREHLLAVHAKRIPQLVVVQNKVDLVSQEQAIKNYNEIKSLLKGKYDNAPIIPVSAQQSVNLEYIYEALATFPLPDRKLDGEPVFIVARSFDINRPGTKPSELSGTVLGGTLKQGKLKVGDEIEIKPGRLVKEANSYRYEVLKTKIRSLYNGSNSVSELTPGGSMSVETELDMSLGKGDQLAGNVLSVKGKLPEASQTLKISYSLFPQMFSPTGSVAVEAIKPSEMLFLSINTSMTVGVVKKVNKAEIELSLKVPVVAFKNDNVAIARNVNTHWRLIGHGNII